MNNNTVVLTTLLNGEQAKKELDEMRVHAQTLSRTIDDLRKSGNHALAKTLEPDLKAARKSMNDLRKQTIDVNHVLNNLNTARPKDLKDALTAMNKQLDSGKIKRGSKDWNDLNMNIRRVRGELNKIAVESQISESRISRIANGFNKYFAGATAAIASVTGASLALRRISEDVAKMDDVYADVMKTTGLTRQEVIALNEEFKKMDTRTSREALNMLARDAGKLGITGKEEILQFVDAANQIDVALGEDLGEGAIRNIGKINDVYKLSTKELTDMDLKGQMLAIGSAINELGQSSTANEQYLVSFTQRLGGVASQAGISVQDILGYASALDQSGQAVEMSATALQNFIMKVMGDPAKFAKLAGIEVKHFSDLLKNDANMAIKTVLKSLSEKGGFQQLIPIFQEMGLDGARAVGVLSSLATNISKVEEAQRISNEAFAEGTSMTDEYGVKNNNLNAQLEKRRKEFKDAALELGERLNPALLKSTNIVTYLVKLLPGLLDFLGKYGKYILYLVTVYAAYTAGVKLNVFWTTKLTDAWKMANIQQKIQNAGYLAGRIAGASYNVVVGALTGNVKRMTSAWKILNATMKSNPLGLAIGAAVALGGSFLLLKNRISGVNSEKKALDSISKDVSKSIADEKSKLDLLLQTARNEKLSKDQRLDAIQKINKISPEYLGNIKLENINSKEAANAIDEYTAAITRNAQQKAIAEKLSDLYVKKIEKEIEITRLNTLIEEDRAKGFFKSNVLLQSSYATRAAFMEKSISGINKEIEAYSSLNKKIEETNATKRKVTQDYDDGNSEPFTSYTPNTNPKSNEDPIKKRLDTLQNGLDKEILILKKNLLEKKISEEEYHRDAYLAEVNHLLAIIELRKEYGIDSTDIETQLTDKMIQESNRRFTTLQQQQKELQDKLKKDHREEPVEEEEYTPEGFQAEKSLLDRKREYEMITEEEYQKALYELRESYLDKYLGKYMQMAEGIQNISAELSGAIDNFQRAEEMSVERKYNKMIKAAGNNSKRVAQLEEEKERKMHEVKAKYADKQFIITVANVISSTALAAMESYKAMAGIPVVGPALGAAAAAAAVLYGAGQIAIAQQQRDAAKEGYAIGGYTRTGNWWEEDGTVHKGEFVGNRFAVANPVVRRIFDIVDVAQRNNTIGSLSERDFQTALNYNEYSQRRMIGEALSNYQPIVQNDNSFEKYASVLMRSVEVNEKLSRKLDDPLIAETYIEGKGGSKMANDLYNRMKKNISRS
jgi:TP901 family phage tail tape measure protein